MTQRFHSARILLISLFLGMLVTGIVGPILARAQSSDTPYVLVITVDGTINSVKERFISRALEKAQYEGSTALIIQLDTPGGLLGPTREIVGLLLESPLPVSVFVYPKGARAGSAGTFIAAAANFAAMSPGSNIGAAAPISSTGEDIDDTLASKVENDAAALIRSIAQVRDRNQDKLEQTVRTALAYSAEEAKAGNVVDFIADDLNDLLTKIDGRIAETSLGPVVLDTYGLELRAFEKNVLEHFLEFISDPNVSFLLLTIGGLGIVVELFNPGLVAPAVVGVICLLLAFLAVGNLPVNWAGVVFVFLAAVLIALEVVVAGFGILGVGAIVCLMIGGLILFAQVGDSSPTMPSISVSKWVLFSAVGVLAMTLGYVVREAHLSRKQNPRDQLSVLVGSIGSVTGELNPTGIVLVGGETWTAVSGDGSVILVGEDVEVQSINGLMLTVFRRI